MIEKSCDGCRYQDRRGHEQPCDRCGSGFSYDKWEPYEVKPAEYTGGSVSYYSIKIDHPTRTRDTYTAECNDIIEALGMNYAEGNAFKAIWRRCAARMGNAKAGYKDGLYDAEKVVFFGERMVAQEKVDK